MQTYTAGGSLKKVPTGNKGLGKLPTAVRNKMGYMSAGGSNSKKRPVAYKYGGHTVPGMFEGSDHLPKNQFGGIKKLDTYLKNKGTQFKNSVMNTDFMKRTSKEANTALNKQKKYLKKHTGTEGPNQLGTIGLASLGLNKLKKVGKRIGNSLSNLSTYNNGGSNYKRKY